MRKTGVVVLAIAILLLIPVYYINYRAEAFGINHDDGLNVVTAESLARTGTYSITSLPAPIPQSKYPILYPALLALLAKLKPAVPENIWLLKLSSLLVAIGWFALAGKYLAKRYSPIIAYAGVAFLMLSPWSIFLSSCVLPDILFSLLCLASVILIDKSSKSTQEWLYIISAALMASAAFQTSTKGITVILAGTAFLLARRSWKQAICFMTVAGVASLPWLLWQRLVPSPNDPILQYYSKASYAAGHIFGNCTPSQACHVLSRNIAMTIQSFSELVGLSLIREIRFAYVLQICLCVLIAAGFFLSIRRRASAADFWAVIQVGMLLCWMWPPNRYLAPLVPIFLGYLGFCLKEFTKRCPDILHPRLIVLYGTLACLFLASSNALLLAKISLATGRPAISLDNGSEDWKANADACAWIRNNTAPDARITANLDPVVYLLTGRKSVRFFTADPYRLFYSPEKDPKPLGNEIKLRNHLVKEGITHLLVTPMDYFEEGTHVLPLLTRLMQSYPGSMHLAGKGQNPDWQIWQVNQQKLQTEITLTQIR